MDFDRSRGVGLFDVSGDRTFGFRLALRTTLDAEDGPEGLSDGGRVVEFWVTGSLDLI